MPYSTPSSSSVKRWLESAVCGSHGSGIHGTKKSAAVFPRPRRFCGARDRIRSSQSRTGLRGNQARMCIVTPRRYDRSFPLVVDPTAFTASSYRYALDNDRMPPSPAKSPFILDNAGDRSTTTGGFPVRRKISSFSHAKPPVNPEPSCLEDVHPNSSLHHPAHAALPQQGRSWCSPPSLVCGRVPPRLASRPRGP